MRLIYVLAVLVAVGYCAEGQQAEPAKVQIQKGSLMLQIKTSDEPVVKHRLDINSKSKAEIRLTQSSKVDIDAEVWTSPLTKIEFSKSGFEPEFFAFRLINDVYPNLTEPVLAEYSEGVFKAVLDIGDPVFAITYSAFHPTLLGYLQSRDSHRRRQPRFQLPKRRSQIQHSVL